MTAEIWMTKSDIVHNVKNTFPTHHHLMSNTSVDYQTYLHPEKHKLTSVMSEINLVDFKTHLKAKY